jgi:hypothetical protein
VTDGTGLDVSASVTGPTTTVALGDLVPALDALTVTYSGDSNYQGSSTTATAAVSPVAPTVDDSGVTGTFTPGSLVHFTVTVTGVPGGSVPTGAVALSDGQGLGGYAVLSDGTASVPVLVSQPLSPGTSRTFVATYYPDASSPSYTVADDSSSGGVTVVSS